MTTPTAPRDDLIRMIDLPAAELRVAATADGTIGTLVGYAAVFDRETIIDSWEGKFREMLVPGSFARTLEQRADRVKVLFNHGFDPSIGDKPLGKPEKIMEKAAGLWTETPLDDTSYNRDLRASLASGALDGMSFRFSVVREEWIEPDEDDAASLPLRRLLEVKLYEFGPVTYPAYEATTAGVRARPAYLAWRTAHQSPTLGPADSGTPRSTDETAESGTSSLVVARPIKAIAQATARARVLASLGDTS